MTGLIIEGGARRGIFTAGITDCLLENKIHFDYVAGVSAGAEVALDFTAKQEGRSRRVIMPHRTGDFSVLGFLSMDLDNMIYRFPYQDYPNLINALMTRFDRYNEQCKRMKQLEEDGILMVLRPSHKYVKSFEMNTDVLDEAYNAGKNLAKEKLAEIEDFLNVLEKK